MRRRRRVERVQPPWRPRGQLTCGCERPACAACYPVAACDVADGGFADADTEERQWRAVWGGES